MTDTLRVAGESEGPRDAGAPNLTGPHALLMFDERLLQTSAEAIRLRSCQQFETIAVKTRRSVYEIVVLDGRTGEVLVRGGSDFPDFCRAVLVGATADGHAIKVNTVDIGLRMELNLGNSTVVTSPVTAIERSARRANQPSIS